MNFFGRGRNDICTSPFDHDADGLENLDKGIDFFDSRYILKRRFPAIEERSGEEGDGAILRPTGLDFSEKLPSSLNNEIHLSLHGRIVPPMMTPCPSFLRSLALTSGRPMFSFLRRRK